MSRRNRNTPTTSLANTDLIIIGGGAAGMMAAATAAELNLRCMVLERNNRTGRKLLMCGNNRCNLTTNLSRDDLIARYTPHNREFLRSALTAFDSKALQRWFNERGLKTVVKESGRVYPKTERASDVANCFKDVLRQNDVPLVLNCPVKGVKQKGDLFQVDAPGTTLFAKAIVIATGGVSYPKTGSVGDGQKFAKSFGHKVTPYRPGLVAYELRPSWWRDVRDVTFVTVGMTVHSSTGDRTFTGGLELRNGLVHGPAMIDASNVISRENLTSVTISVDLLPNLSRDELLRKLQSGTRLKDVLSSHLPKDAAAILLKRLMKSLDDHKQVADAFKNADLPIKGPRPLKEAMVTVGGIELAEIDSRTMQSTRCPGLYFAGEALDMEGPCGGFNLQAAFATARLAVTSIADSQPRKKYWE